MNGRGRFSVVALAVLAIFLLASNLREVEKRKSADSARDKAFRELQSSNDKIVDKLAQYLVAADVAAVEAKRLGEEATLSREKLLESLKNTLDPDVIQRAVEKANKNSPATRGAPGPPGPTGPQGQTGQTGQTGATGPSATTTTTRRGSAPAPTSTTTTTFTPKKCIVNLLGVCL